MPPDDRYPICPPGFLADYIYTTAASGTMPKPYKLPWTLGVRRNEISDCDVMGRYRFEGLPALGLIQAFAILAYRTEPDTGEITATTDMGRRTDDISFFTTTQGDPLPIRSVAFDCRQITLAGLYDPRFLQDLDDMLPLDGDRGDVPQRYAAILGNKMLAAFVDEDARTAFCFRFGRIGNRLLLLNVPARKAIGGNGSSSEARGEGRGFTPRQYADLGPIALASAQDFWQLDDLRLTDYRKAGVSSELLDRLHHETRTQMDVAQDALHADDGAACSSNANAALATEVRVYDATQAMANDVTHAAIFLLAFCVPFSLCMEHLLIGSSSIYRQIGGAVGIFSLMTAALWQFHPAFKISSSPLVIVLAFGIVFMSAASAAARSQAVTPSSRTETAPRSAARPGTPAPARSRQETAARGERGCSVRPQANRAPCAWGKNPRAVRRAPQTALRTGPRRCQRASPPPEGSGRRSGPRREARERARRGMRLRPG